SFGFGLSGLDSAPDAGQAASSQALARLEDRLAALEGAARDAHKTVARQTLKLALPIIVRYVKAELGRDPSA
ncbi:MAG TPA: hypothetical protein DCQ73_03260, partial [Spirochaetaceae bacterium]|nr:hypothetical protein [Spirochaetaceae bacterium]